MAGGGEGAFDGVEGMEVMQSWRAGIMALGCESCMLLMGPGMCRSSISSLSLSLQHHPLPSLSLLSLLALLSLL